MLWIGLPLLAPVYLLLCGIALYEYSAMLRLRGITVRLRSLWVAAALTLPASLPASYLGMRPLGTDWREALLGLFIFYLVGTEVLRPNSNSFNSLVFTLFGYLYIPWLFSFVITLRYTPDGVLGLWYLTLPMLAVIGADVGGFTFGTLFGRHKLAPHISPKKTVEGAVGGMVLAIAGVVSIIVALETWQGVHIDWVKGIVLGVLAAVAAQLGDLFESLFKRWAGVKDTGVFLPGQGGVLDRIDGILIAVPVAYLFVILVVLRN